MEKYIFSAEKRLALESLRQPFAVYQFIDKRIVTLLLSDGFLNLFGYSSREAALYDMDNDMYKDTHPDDVSRIANAAIHFAEEGGKYEVIYRTKQKTGSDYVVVHAAGEHIYTEEGTRLAQVWYTDEGTYVENCAAEGFDLNQIMSRALHEESILETIHYDFLTGLPNMTYFFELAEERKKKILREGGQPVLLYFDFSGMKFFNAKYGFAEGDKMLQAFARLLTRAFSYEDICRIGADHFAAIAENEGLEETLGQIIR
ncbi:MAG: sensor domain-containing diguanylate cyclase, partial [Lachnospiraceae bacterium]|nr:sensor domain-containing diguanylate cyclase [Lachnospiraceae bacterium]